MKEIKGVAGKLAEARVRVSVEKTGTNAFAKYKYYQIEEIYSEAKKIFSELGLVTIVNTDIQIVGEKIYKKFTMNVIDVENVNDRLEFSVITEPASLKGAQAPQEAGADITYMTKYLYGLSLMLDDGANDPDANNTHTEEPVKKSLTRAEKIEKANGLDSISRDKFIEKYKADSGMSLSANPTYWKNDVLDILCKEMGWVR